MSAHHLGGVVTVGPNLCCSEDTSPLTPLPSPQAPSQQHLEKPAAHKQRLPSLLSLLPVITALLKTPLDIRLGGSISLSQPHFLALKSGSDAKSRVDMTLFIILCSYSQGYPVLAKATSHLSFQL